MTLISGQTESFVEKLVRVCRWVCATLGMQTTLARASCTAQRREAAARSLRSWSSRAKTSKPSASMAGPAFTMQSEVSVCIKS